MGKLIHGKLSSVLGIFDSPLFFARRPSRRIILDKAALASRWLVVDSRDSFNSRARTYKDEEEREKQRLTARPSRGPLESRIPLARAPCVIFFGWSV